MSFTAFEMHLSNFATLVWGWPMLIALMVTGIWLTVLLRGLQFRMLLPAMYDAFCPHSRHTRGEGMISNRSALFTALAATVGTGNIAGVATAIALGGPGAMFWMWMSGLFGMALKFSEALLGVHYRVKDKNGQFRGGPMYYLTHGAKAPWLGAVFAGALAFAALCTGGMVQNNSIADAMLAGFGLNPTWVGLAVTAVSAAVMLGGLGRIARAADLLVPSMIVVYAAAGTLVIVVNSAMLPQILHAIFTEAFTGSAAAGGFAGSSVLLAMRYGLARGVFANESGLGSAPIVAATAQTRHPTEQALVSMTQTFIDTFFVCTFTGMVILITGAWQSLDVASAGASLTNLAFNQGLGNVALAGIPLGSGIVSLCLLLFAFTTILGWGFYGQQGAMYLLGPKVAKPYLWLFLACTFFGAAILDWAESIRQGVHFIWVLADLGTAAMMLPNLFGLLVMSGTIKKLAFDYIQHTRTGKPLLHKPFYFTAVPAKAPVKAVKAKPKTKAKIKPRAKPRKRR
ncbi:MAG TPA: sodium:alanine symporter family protein [Alphaproteobacteria bacterium]|nr:sodium:alanine symporter family protein [Alphaproteobacteria bacterium]